MGHYETLGVDPAASVGEIRQSYLRLARREHPDLHNQTAASRTAAQEKMRRINGAWAVLGDPDGRAAYDRERRRGTRPLGPGVAPGDAKSGAWIDERFDRPITSGGLPSWLAVAPVLLLVSGLVALVGGAFVGVQPAVVLGVGALVVSAILFLSAPLVALGRSRQGDRLG